MNVLVTGGAGFIGRALSTALFLKGETVTVFDNLVGQQPPPEGVRFMHGDVSRWEDFIQFSDQTFDVVYHLAASFANEKSVDNHLLDAQSNIIGTINVCRLAQQVKANRIIYTGSSSSYGGKEQDLPFIEDGPVRPSTPYALSKHVGEYYVEASAVPYTICRLFNVFGPGDIPGHYRNAIPNMIMAGATKGRITVFGEAATRDFTFINDLVGFLVSGALGGPSVIVNLCTGVETRMVDVATLISNEVGAEVVILPSRHWDKVLRRVGNPSKLLSMYPAAYDWGHYFQERVALTVQWVLSTRGKGFV